MICSSLLELCRFVVSRCISSQTSSTSCLFRWTFSSFPSGILLPASTTTVAGSSPFVFTILVALIPVIISIAWLKFVRFAVSFAPAFSCSQASFILLSHCLSSSSSSSCPISFTTCFFFVLMSVLASYPVASVLMSTESWISFSPRGSCAFHATSRRLASSHLSPLSCLPLVSAKIRSLVSSPSSASFVFFSLTTSNTSPLNISSSISSSSWLVAVAVSPFIVFRRMGAASLVMFSSAPILLLRISIVHFILPNIRTTIISIMILYMVLADCVLMFPY